MFNQFLDDLGDLRDRPVPLKSIKKLLKIEEKAFPKNIHTYFGEFAKHAQGKWQRKDKMIFLWTVLKYLERFGRSDFRLGDEDWSQISQILGVPQEILNAKWIGMLKTNLKVHPWSAQEDVILTGVMTQEFQSWTNVAIEFNKRSTTMRHAKQVRERWNNYLNPDLNKTAWSEQEQIQLLSLVQKIGKKWSQIARQIKGRTENQVKNAYNSLMNQYRRTHMQTLESDDQIVQKLLAVSDPQPQGQSNTNFVNSPLFLQQQQFFLQAYLNEQLKSLAYLAQFARFVPQQQL